MGCANSTVLDTHDDVVAEVIAKNVGTLTKPTPFAQGSVDEFEFLGKLGQGAYATVHMARSLRTGGGIVAVKVIDLREKGASDWSEGQLSEQRLYAMEEEVQILSRVTGKPNVIDFMGSFRDSCLSYLVMEKCSCSLLQAIDRLPSITETTMRRILREMLQGIAAVHQVGVVHRDVKPDNFLCVGDKDTVKLCDFGLAGIINHRQPTLTGVFGTPPFMCPEMLNGKGYDTSADMWSFGVILYSLFYGRFPYEPLERTGKAMKDMIKAGVPAPCFRPPSALGDAPLVSANARELAAASLHREPSARLTARVALSHVFFASPGKTLLTPMIESAKVFGAFCTLARNNAIRKNEVDLRLEHMQRLKLRSTSKNSSRCASKAHSHFDDDCSTNMASSFAYIDGPTSPTSTIPSFDELPVHANAPGGNEP